MAEFTLEDYEEAAAARYPNVVYDFGSCDDGALPVWRRDRLQLHQEYVSPLVICKYHVYSISRRIEALIKMIDRNDK